ncbi:unnamed protein product, partial [Choristocarpus tenellus]
CSCGLSCPVILFTTLACLSEPCRHRITAHATPVEKEHRTVHIAVTNITGAHIIR